jgi:hypothetical protein
MERKGPVCLSGLRGRHLRCRDGGRPILPFSILALIRSFLNSTLISSNLLLLLVQLN